MACILAKLFCFMRVTARTPAFAIGIGKVQHIRQRQRLAVATAEEMFGSELVLREEALRWDQKS